MATQLIESGHRNFALIGGSANSHPSKERENGFLEALKQNEIKFDKKYSVTNG